MHLHDAIIVGGGPAGSSCAAFCAAAGLRVRVIERARFPRDKVCGDCLNPDCWPVFERLGIEDAVRALPHAALRAVEFVGLGGEHVRVPLPDRVRGEIAVKRSALDALLLATAAARGAEVFEGRAAARVRPLDSGYEIETTAANDAAGTEVNAGRFVVAADGRNSVVARLVGLLNKNPAPSRTALIGLQTHIRCAWDFGARVQMRWFARGYGGMCPVGGGELNISLAGPPGALPGLKRWVRAEFDLPTEPTWRAIAPFDRSPAVHVARAAGTGGIFLVGDAARVVEPFTGEGIYYALRSGELAAQAIIAAVHGGLDAARAVASYRKTHADMYRGRMWVNKLARAAGRHPRLASLALAAARWRPETLALLTGKVVR